MKIGILPRIALVASMFIGASTTVAEPPRQRRTEEGPRMKSGRGDVRSCGLPRRGGSGANREH